MDMHTPLPPPPFRSGQGCQTNFAYVSKHFKTKKKCNTEKKILSARNFFENRKKKIPNIFFRTI